MFKWLAGSWPHSMVSRISSIIASKKVHEFYEEEKKRETIYNATLIIKTSRDDVDDYYGHDYYYER